MGFSLAVVRAVLIGGAYAENSARVEEGAVDLKDVDVFVWEVVDLQGLALSVDVEFCWFGEEGGVQGYELLGFADEKEEDVVAEPVDGVSLGVPRAMVVRQLTVVPPTVRPSGI